MPVMFKVDMLDQAQMRLEVTTALHRYAGRKGFSTMPRMSSIDRGRYYAEIDRVVMQDGRYVHTVPNVALGTGDTPLDAALHGYRQVLRDDPMMAVFSLEVEAVHLVSAIRKRQALETKLDHLLDDLTKLVRTVNVYDPNEDDDL